MTDDPHHHARSRLIAACTIGSASAAVQKFGPNDWCQLPEDDPSFPKSNIPPLGPDEIAIILCKNLPRDQLTRATLHREPQRKIAPAAAPVWTIMDMTDIECVPASTIEGVGGTPDQWESLMRRAGLFKARHTARSGTIVTVTIETKDGRALLYFPDPEICEMTRRVGLATGELKPR
jgi:hypothetical protein